MCSRVAATDENEYNDRAKRWQGERGSRLPATLAGLSTTQCHCSDAWRQRTTAAGGFFAVQAYNLQFSRSIHFTVATNFALLFGAYNLYETIIEFDLPPSDHDNVICHELSQPV